MKTKRSLRHAVIYIPGLGDHRYKGQQLLTKTWRLWGVTPYILPLCWGDQSAFAPKLQKLVDLVDELTAKGYTVSLVGASAGAGAVINAFAAKKDVIRGVVCIAGKVNNPHGIGGGYSRRNPAFVESAHQVQFSLDQLDFDTDRPRIMSRYAMFDPIVPRQDSVIAGAHNKTVLTSGHAVTIATQLLFGAPFWIRFLKNLA